MPFLKRLGFYLAGLSVGLVFLTYVYKKKSDETGVSFCYFPNCRVLKELRSKPLSYSGVMKGIMAEQGLDSTDIAYFLTDGDIEFRQSDPEATPCSRYLIQGSIEGKEAFLEVRNCENSVIAERYTR